MRYAILISSIFIFLLYSPTLRAETQNGDTVSQDEVKSGTPGNDNIDSGDGDDNVHGMGGDDTIDAGSGDDLVSGGPGDDKIRGGNGDDYIIGGEGNDIVDGGSGNDYVRLGPGDDTFVYNLKDNKGFSDYADAGEGIDTLVIVTDYEDDQLAKDIMEHYKGQGIVGKDIADFNGVNVALGVSNFENLVVQTKFTF